MLRIWSKYVDQGGYLSLGEWKVVAAPGRPATPGALDVADPALGGHLVASEPYIDDLAQRDAILDADTARQTLDLGDPRTFGMVVGFQDGRAARVTEVRWIDPGSSKPDERLERVDVLTSLRSAAGPWRLAGSWDLTRGTDGMVSPFEFEDGEWVRYLRLQGRSNQTSTSVELPGQLQVLEQSVDSDYRSVIGEWGYHGSAGPYEWLQSAALTAYDPDIDAGDDAEGATELVAGSDIHRPGRDRQGCGLVPDRRPRR